VTAARLGRAALGMALDAVLPMRCLRCGAAIEADGASGGAVCSECWRLLRFLAAPACACCGYPFEFETPPGTLCAACRRRLPDFARARAVFAYDDVSRGLILSFKHADRIHGAPAFGRWLARAGAALTPDADLIVPVPLHRWRLFARRYNQSALLAHALGRAVDRPVAVDLLVRRRRTPPQGRLSRSARIRNMRGAFAVRPRWRARLRGARILLVDDVLTTGATAEACARALVRAGANAVDVLTLARVVRPRP